MYVRTLRMYIQRKKKKGLLDRSIARSTNKDGEKVVGGKTAGKKTMKMFDGRGEGERKSGRDGSEGERERGVTRRRREWKRRKEE